MCRVFCGRKLYRRYYVYDNGIFIFKNKAHIVRTLYVTHVAWEVYTGGGGVAGNISLFV